MKNLIHILSLAVLAIAISCSHKTYRTLSDDRGTNNPVATQSEEEVAVQKEVFDSPLLRFKRADKVGIILDKEDVEVNEKQADEQSYIEYETPPQFPGGKVAMISYIYDNLRFPKQAYDENIQGRVVVQFLVDKKGNVDSIKVVKSKDPYLDAEAIRIIKSFPKFTPGKLDSITINQWMTLPIMFKKTDYDNRVNTKYRAFQFDNGDDYVRDGLYRIVDERGKIGYADDKGKTVITPRFAFGFPFENGNARVTDTGIRVDEGEHWRWESNDWYYIDKTGRRLERCPNSEK